jgi:hypothetical protein
MQRVFISGQLLFVWIDEAESERSKTVTYRDLPEDICRKRSSAAQQAAQSAYKKLLH